MDTLAIRLKESRKEKKLSQQKLAELADVHYTNVGKYERGEATPSASVLNRISQALEISPDFLMNGTLKDKADNSLADEELLVQFKKVEKLSDRKKQLVKEFLDAFLFKSTVQNLAS